MTAGRQKGRNTEDQLKQTLKERSKEDGVVVSISHPRVIVNPKSFFNSISSHAKPAMSGMVKTL